LQLRFFLLEDNEGLAAAALCAVIATAAASNSLDAILFGRASSVAHALGVSTRPVLVFNTPLGRYPSVLLRAGQTCEQTRLLRSLLDAIEQHASSGGFGVAFFGVTTEEPLLQAALRSRRYLQCELDSTATMDIEWSNFDGYVAHLRAHSKQAAQNARTERSRNRRSGVSIRRLQPDEADLQALHEFTRDHYRRKNGKDPQYGPQFLPQLFAQLGDDLLVFEAVREGTRVAMLAVVRSGSVGWVAWVGMGADDRPNDFTYTTLTYYHAAECAAALGLKTLLYGTAVQQLKLKRGCRLLECHLFYRPQHSVARPLAALWLSILQRWQRIKHRR
jgi:predicted N-acyltransferase